MIAPRRRIGSRTAPASTGSRRSRLYRTLLSGWAYGAIYRSSTERTAVLDGWLWHYNHRRKHSALAQPPTAHRSPQRPEPTLMGLTSQTPASIRPSRLLLPAERRIDVMPASGSARADSCAHRTSRAAGRRGARPFSRASRHKSQSWPPYPRESLVEGNVPYACPKPPSGRLGGLLLPLASTRHGQALVTGQVGWPGASQPPAPTESRRDSLPSPGSSHRPVRASGPTAIGRTGRALLRAVRSTTA